MVTFNLTFQLSHSQYTDTVAAVVFFLTGLPCISHNFRIGYGGSSQLAYNLITACYQKKRTSKSMY